MPTKRTRHFLAEQKGVRRAVHRPAASFMDETQDRKKKAEQIVQDCMEKIADLGEDMAAVAAAVSRKEDFVTAQYLPGDETDQKALLATVAVACSGMQTVPEPAEGLDAGPGFVKLLKRHPGETDAENIARWNALVEKVQTMMEQLPDDPDIGVMSVFSRAGDAAELACVRAPSPGHFAHLMHTACQLLMEAGAEKENVLQILDLIYSLIDGDKETGDAE